MRDAAGSPGDTALKRCPANDAEGAMRYAVAVRHVTKTYRLYPRPVDRLLEALLRRPRHTAFHALEDVSFALHPGTTLGLIGENGAGKSTLLKILAGTLAPSSGTAVVHGRVAALLELGAGFHQEFTGRQNIFLNASLLGLTPEEIRRREPEIIAFAGLGDFIDRPIKTYSSGMVVRLAFSIATSVDPDVLIIDEALSVGDQRFQQKCVERMTGFRKAGKTIIVCSHSMYLINELCAFAAWIEQGRVREYGATAGVVSRYLAHFEHRDGEQQARKGMPQQSEKPDVAVEAVWLTDEQETTLDAVAQFSDLVVRVRTRRDGPPFTGHLAVILESGEESAIFSALTKTSGTGPVRFHACQEWGLRIPRLVLQKGSMRVRALITDEQALRLVDERASGFLPVLSDHPEYGLVWMEHEWLL